MDWAEYKARCDEPNVFSRWMLEQTRLLVDAEVAVALTRFLDEAPLEKPRDHKGGGATDMFVVDLGFEHLETIVRHLERAKAEGRTTSSGRGLGGFVEAWLEYRRSMP